MAKLTSAQANKLLKKKETELENLENDQNSKMTFHCAVGEQEDDVRPQGYDIDKYYLRLVSIQSDIRVIKHAINTFNVNTVLPDVHPSITIDQVLVYLPQLQHLYRTYKTMGGCLPKTRVLVSSNVIDYQITNYNPDDARSYADKLYDEIQQLQMSLDKANNSIEGVEIPDYIVE